MQKLKKSWKNYLSRSLTAVQCGNDIRLSPSAAEVLDEGEGLEDDGHVGVEDPVDVGINLGHGLKFIFQF